MTTSFADGWPDTSTAHVADAAEQTRHLAGFGPPGMKPVHVGMRCVGRAIPIVHSGSIDVILEALDRVCVGDILVIDDQGRMDRACVGDLVALEARSAGVAGMIIYGCHRDTAQVVAIGLPVFSFGARPNGPALVEQGPADPFASCQVGAATVRLGDLIIADADGVVVVAAKDAGVVGRAALDVAEQEASQVSRLRAGESLRQQFAFDEYLRLKAADSELTFRRHLTALDETTD